MINEQQAAMISVVAILFIICVFVRCMRKIDEAEKGDKMKVYDVIHMELLKTMPGICTNQFKVAGIGMTDNICDSNVSGMYDDLIFDVKIQTSDAMGECRIVSVKKVDKNHMSYLLEKNFKEDKAITGFKNDNFIKRLGRRICSIFPGCCGKLNIG